MTFLTPALLALGAAVVVPLVLHLFHRDQAPRLVFPAVRYLRRAEQEHATRIRLQQLLLMALRAMGILLLAAAAARPFLRGADGTHAPTAVAIVLDNSMSSGAVVGERRLLDDLKAGALATLEAAGPDDVFWLLRAGAPWEPAIRGTAADVARAVEATEPTEAGSDLGAMLTRARGVLAGSGLGAREIHLLSDLQSAAFATRPAHDSVHTPVRLLTSARPPANRAVTAVEVGGGLPPRAGERSTVSATVGPGGPAVGSPAGSGSPADSASPGPSSPGDSVAVRLILDGSVRAVAHAAVGASAVLPFPAREPGPVAGRVEIDRDALAADDRRRFAVNVTRPPAVAVAAPLPFLEEALDVLAGAGRIRRAAPESADVLVSPGGRAADALLRGTSTIILPPATPLERGAVNRRLTDAGIPWRLDPPLRGEGRIDTAGLAPAGVLAGVRLRQVYDLARTRPAADADSVLIRLRSGEPWVVTGRAGNRQEGAGAPFLLLATPLTVEAGTLPTSAAMVPLLDRAINVWAASARPAVDFAPGDVATLPAGDSIVAPDGSTHPVQDGASHRLTTAGIYRVLAGDEVVAALAVNPPASESDLTPLPVEEAAARIPGDVRVAGPGEWSDVVYHRRLGREMTVPLIVVAVAVLVLESAVAAAGRVG